MVDTYNDTNYFTECEILDFIKSLNGGRLLIIFLTNLKSNKYYKLLTDKISIYHYDNIDMNLINRDIIINNILNDEPDHNKYIIISNPEIIRDKYIRNLIPCDKILILPTIKYNDINNDDVHIKGGNSVLYEADVAINISEHGLFYIVKNRFGKTHKY